MGIPFTIPEREVELEIQSYNIVFGFSVTVVYGVGEKDDQGNFVFDQPQNFKSVEIDGLYYQALMSPNPPWSPDKPAGTFRRNDLWEAINAKQKNIPLEFGTGKQS
jgi:hypothetical protein